MNWNEWDRPLLSNGLQWQAFGTYQGRWQLCAYDSSEIVWLLPIAWKMTTGIVLTDNMSLTGDDSDNDAGF